MRQFIILISLYIGLAALIGCHKSGSENPTLSLSVETETVSVEKSAFVSGPTVTSPGDEFAKDIDIPEAMLKGIVQIGDTSYQLILYNNETTKELIARMPIEIDMKELNGNEKYYYFSECLPANSQDVGSIRTGDLMLYGSDCLVLFYEDFNTSYRYTPLGYLENPEELAAVLGRGQIGVGIFVINEEHR